MACPIDGTVEIMRSIDFDPNRPFRYRQARSAGVSRAQIESRQYQRLMHDCYVGAGVTVDLRLLVQAAMLVVPGAWCATHHTAGRLLGGVVPDSGLVHLGAPRGITSRRPELQVHRYRERPETIVHRGIRMTTPARTFRDLAGELDLIDLVAFGDSLARHDAGLPARLRQESVRWAGPGSMGARQAAALVRRGVDSPNESRLRLLMTLAGLPEPVINHELRDESGRVIYRLDLAYPHVRLAIEYDGRHHIDRTDQWRRDLLRREDLEGGRWRIVVLVAEDLFITPERTLERITAAMAAQGMRVPRLRPTWRRYFPGRRGVA